jgi:SAM-dependent methyltransferase
MLDIPKEEWAAMNQQYTPEQIKKNIADHIVNGDIDLPLIQFTQEEFEELFRRFCNTPTKGPQISDNCYAALEYKYPVTKKYFDGNQKFNGVSNMFQQFNRWNCGSVRKNNRTPIEEFRNLNIVYGYLNYLYTMKCQKVGRLELRQMMALRGYIASQFRPAIAKEIYEYFGAKDVLDFSSGWGDRLAGFYAASCTESYIGIDPNPKTFEVYWKQADAYSKLTTPKKVHFINKPAEDVKLPDAIVDMVFTSPPYFNTEIYDKSSEKCENQSFKRYNSVDGWLNGFMLPTLNMAYKALKPGGILAVNIADIYHGPKNTVRVCDPMNDYIHEQLGMKWVDEIGMRLSQRPNSNRFAGSGSVFVEPIWIWQKV